MSVNISFLDSTDYFSIVFGGLFSLATIMIAVFSIVSGEIKKRTRGFSIIELPRYNIFLLLFPIYLVFILFLICSIFDLTDNLLFLILCFLVVLTDISVQTFYILQPFYDVTKIKKFVLDLYKNKFKRKILKSVVDDDVIDVLSQECKYSLDCREPLKDEANNSVIIELTLTEKKDLFKYYVKIIHDKVDSVNADLECLIFSIGLDYLKNDFFDIVDDLNIDRKILLGKILELNQKEYNTLYVNIIISLFQSLYQVSDVSVCDELKEFHIQCLTDNRNLNVMCDFLLDNDAWTYADSFFVYEELNFLVRIRNAGLMKLNSLDSNKIDIINHILDGVSKKEEVNVEDKKLSEKINMIINTLGVDEDEKD